MSGLTALQGALWVLTSSRPGAASTGQSAASPSQINNAASSSIASLAQSAITSRVAAKAVAQPQPASTAPYIPLTVAAQVVDGQVTGTAEGGIADNTSLYSNWQDFIAQTSMSSQQLSSLAYSGSALPAGDGSWSQTFVQAVNTLYTEGAAIGSIGQGMIAWVGQGRPANGVETGLDNMTDAQVTALANGLIAEAANGDHVADAITSAYDNHTLTVQNASQVQGLDFEESWSATETANGTAGNGSSLTFNNDFLSSNPDGRQHALLPFGDTYAYLTW